MVAAVQQRINEAARLVLLCCILPKISAKDITIPDEVHSGGDCQAAGLIEKMVSEATKDDCMMIIRRIRD